MNKLYLAIITLDNKLTTEDDFGKRLEYDLHTEIFPKWVAEQLPNMKLEVNNGKMIYR